ncbi:MAG TPA: hypothetical protein VFN10_05890 [Thermoanaerobaculia bacterium]|nr:hypothetical protein [Thermoanaerobaculia bacterium]
MIDFEVGTTTVATYEVRKIDSDYFTEDQRCAVILIRLTSPLLPDRMPCADMES